MGKCVECQFLYGHKKFFCSMEIDRVPEEFIYIENTTCYRFKRNPIAIQQLKDWLRRDDLTQKERDTCNEMLDLLEGVIPIPPEEKKRIEYDFGLMRQL